MKFKRVLALTAVAAIMVMALAGCKDGKTGDQVEFKKDLEQVVYEEGEPFENEYYKTVTKEDEGVFFQVKPKNGKVMDVSVTDTVIYGLAEGEKPFIEKVTLNIDGKPISQYQLHVALENNADIVVPESGTSITEKAPENAPRPDANKEADTASSAGDTAVTDKPAE